MQKALQLSLPRPQDTAGPPPQDTAPARSQDTAWPQSSGGPGLAFPLGATEEWQPGAALRFPAGVKSQFAPGVGAQVCTPGNLV